MEVNFKKEELYISDLITEQLLNNDAICSQTYFQYKNKNNNNQHYHVHICDKQSFDICMNQIIKPGIVKENLFNLVDYKNVITIYIDSEELIIELQTYLHNHNIKQIKDNYYDN